MSRVIEDVGLPLVSMIHVAIEKMTNCSGINGHSTGVGGWVRFLTVCLSMDSFTDSLHIGENLPSMKLQSLEALTSHDALRLTLLINAGIRTTASSNQRGIE